MSQQIAARRASSGSLAPMKGIACMIVAGLALTLNDGALKWLAGDYPVGQIMFYRGLFVFLPVIFLTWRAGGLPSLRMVSPLAHLLRAGLVVAGTFLFITGLRFLPLADAIAITFAGPLFLTALAGPLLGEIIGWRRWLAVAVGFVGVLIILQPTGNVVQWAALLPLAASLTGALRDILTRRMTYGESSVAVLFTTTLAVTLAGGATFVGGWVALSGEDLLLMAISGLLVGTAHFLMIEALRLGEAALVVPFKYVSVIWALLIGFFVWASLPSLGTLLGAAIIVSSGLYILRRQGRAPRD
jgi:drug/metabolite transporter (DMT)-like permease